MDSNPVVQLASIVDLAQVVETTPIIEIMAAVETTPVVQTASVVDITSAARSISVLPAALLIQTPSTSTMAIDQSQMSFSPFPLLPLELRRKIVVIPFCSPAFV